MPVSAVKILITAAVTAAKINYDYSSHRPRKTLISSSLIFAPSTQGGRGGVDEMNPENPWKTEQPLKSGPFRSHSSQKRYSSHTETRHMPTL
jgi:hypothetical protein